VNKKIIIIIIVLVLIIVGVLLVKKAPQSPTSQTPQGSTETSSQKIQGTIKSLLSSGKSQKCTYSSKVESMTGNGTVYIANGKMRGDFTSITAETKVNGHMIVDAGYSYVWTDSTKQGIKMAIDQAQPSGSPSDSQGPDLNQQFAYTCTGWSADNSIFTPPTDVTFSTFTLPVAQPSGVLPSGSEANPAGCSVCDNIPEGAARDTCKTQLNCE
jgi:hypothetical protein